MSLFQIKGVGIEKKIWDFFVVQKTTDVWARLLGLVIFLNVLGIGLSLFFFFRVKDMNQQIISPVTVGKTEDIDRSSVYTTLEAFSRRVVEYDYRKANGVSIPEPR